MRIRSISLVACALAFLMGVLVVSCTKSGKDRNESDDAETEEVESDETEITDVVRKWNKSLNLRDEKMSNEVYAPSVEFYGRNLSAEECTAMRIDRATSDPTWQQEIISEINLERQDDGSVIASFTKQSDSKKGKHTYPAYLILKKSGGKWKITNESDKLTDKNLKNKKDRKVPENAVRGDFDGDGQIDNVWIDPKYDDDGYVVDRHIKLRSDNPALEGLSWDNAPRGVVLLNLGDLNNSNRDFLGAVPCFDSTWRMFETYGFKNGKWKSVLPQFSVWTGNDDYNRVWKSSRRGYVVISTNDMADSDGGFENTTQEVKLNF